MNIRSLFSPILVLLLGTIITTTQPARALAPDQGPSAVGQGQFTFNANVTNFEFDVSANKNGHAHGRAVFENLSDDTSVVIRVDCMRASSEEALITGTVLRSDDPAFPKSTNVLFAAVDLASGDMITPLFVSPFFDCHSAGSPLTLFRLPGDAIQIEP